MCLDSRLGPESLNGNGCFRWVGDPPTVQGIHGFGVPHCPIAYILYQHIINVIVAWVIVVGQRRRRSCCEVWEFVREVISIAVGKVWMEGNLVCGLRLVVLSLTLFAKFVCCGENAIGKKCDGCEVLDGADMGVDQHEVVDISKVICV